MIAFNVAVQKAPACLLFTCEHASDFVPAACKTLLRGSKLRGTHRELDLGALPVARFLARRFHAPLYVGGISRLLIDLNRSAHNPSVLSPLVRDLGEAAAGALLARYHTKHWNRIFEHIATALSTHREVFHIAVHSFTPVLTHDDGRKDARTADLGLLYNPQRLGERNMAAAWVTSLRQVAPQLLVRRNYPYLGTGDGLATSLRQRFSAARYVGFEVELNQALLQPKPRQDVLNALQASLNALGF